MKKKLRKSIQKKLATGVVAIIAMSFGFGSAVQAGDCSHGAASKSVPNVRYEMVPHVVLPESIQYHPVAKKTSRPNIDLDSASDYGMVSPFVASYTAFPSYQAPFNTEMRTLNQAVYPVSPKAMPMPLPAKKEETVEDSLELTSDDNAPDSNVAPILLASGSEEIVHAMPLEDYNNDVQQTGLFCQKPAKPPAAWSFSSPIFKAASVPMGWGPAGHGGYINQTGPRGCSTQVGFNPMMGGGMMPQDGMGGMGMMQPPMRTFQIGPSAGMNPNGMGGMQVATLPNGMLLLTAPPDHARCGLLRCRCGNQPRMMLLPGAPGGMPGMGPAGGPEAMMMPGMQNMMAGGMMGGMPYQSVGMQGMPGMGMMAQNPMMGGMGMNPMMMQQQMMQQPQMMPVTVMTPYGMTVVGYQQVPSMNPMMGGMGMNPMMMQGMSGMGYGMMPEAYAQQMMQMQAAQLQTQMQAQKGPAATNGEAGKDEASQELKAPLPIGSQLPQMPSYSAMFANPYGMYAQQAGQTGQADAGAEQTCMMNPMAMQGMMPGMMPMMMTPPMMMQMPQMPMNPYAGMYMTPYGMMAMNPMMGGMGMNGGMMNPMMMQQQMMPGMMGMGYGMMPCNFGGMANMMGNTMNRDNVSVSDLIQIMMLMNNNKPEPRQGPIRRLFSRFRERRAENHQGNDPFAQMMQAWSTPYYPSDTAMRMPSRSAYPYGYFGAQPGGMDTANYGGFYNLYMGNTSYPGLY